jgi:hypothetical protein
MERRPSHLHGPEQQAALLAGIGAPLLGVAQLDQAAEQLVRGIDIEGRAAPRGHQIGQRGGVARFEGERQVGCLLLHYSVASLVVALSERREALAAWPAAARASARRPSTHWVSKPQARQNARATGALVLTRRPLLVES